MIGPSVPVWRARGVLGSTDPNTCAATLSGAYSDLYERMGAVPIVIIVILVAAWLRSKLK